MRWLHEAERVHLHRALEPPFVEAANNRVMSTVRLSQAVLHERGRVVQQLDPGKVDDAAIGQTVVLLRVVLGGWAGGEW